MKICRILLAMVTMLITPSGAEETERDASWYYPMLHAEGSRMHLLTDEQLDVIAKLPSEEIHGIVEAMFLASAGVKEWNEIELWKTLKTKAEKESRSAENAAYRADTLPWLLEAYAPGNPPTPNPEAEGRTRYAVRPTATPTPAPTITPAPTATPVP